VSRMRIDDLRPYIYRTRDRGRTWQSISAGLPPDAPVNAVREDPQRRGLLYAATENAVWTSFDDGGHWDSLQLNLPHTSMRDLCVHDDDLIVATHGRSIWILDDISRLRQLGAVPLRDVVLFRPAPAWRVPRSTWTDTPLPPDEPLASNPPVGAVIEYFLPRDAGRPVSLEVLDSRGGLVRRYRSDDPPEPGAQELARELIPQYWIRPARILPSLRGMHRWVWDLRYAAPLSVTRGYPISAVPHATPPLPEGPVALPGSYLVRLTVDGRRFETALTLQQDPRVRLPPEALAQQLRLAIQLAGLLTESSRTLLTARSVQAQLQALAPSGATAEVAHAYDARLSKLLGSADQKEDRATAEAAPEANLKEVQEHLAALYAELTRGDAPPTAAQLGAAETERSALASLQADWRSLLAGLPDLNRRLQSARRAPIRPQLPPPRDVSVADED